MIARRYLIHQARTATRSRIASNGLKLARVARNRRLARTAAGAVAGVPAPKGWDEGVGLELRAARARATRGPCDSSAITVSAKPHAGRPRSAGKRQAVLHHALAAREWLRLAGQEMVNAQCVVARFRCSRPAAPRMKAPVQIVCHILRTHPLFADETKRCVSSFLERLADAEPARDADSGQRGTVLEGRCRKEWTWHRWNRRGRSAIISIRAPGSGALPRGDR